MLSLLFMHELNTQEAPFELSGILEAEGGGGEGREKVEGRVTVVTYLMITHWFSSSINIFLYMSSLKA